MVDPSREAIDKLLAIGSAAIFGEFRHEDDALLTPFPSLVNLLMRKNAFTAFESAMEVYGVHGSRGDSVELISWNFAPEAWRHSFSGLSDDWLFFAQDIYGMQFALQRSGKVSRFDPQTGSMEPLAPSLEDWAALILDDYRSLTGWPIAHEWQTKHGPLAAGWRLVPRTPFILGGDFTAPNLRCVPSRRAMEYYASVYLATRGLEDGMQVDWVDPLSSVEEKPPNN